MKILFNKSSTIFSILIVFSFLFSNLPASSLAPNCPSGFSLPFCPKGTQNDICPFDTFSICAPEGPRCCKISVMFNSDFSPDPNVYDCSAGIIPECVCDTTRLINLCSGIGIVDFNTCDCITSLYSCNAGTKCPSNPQLPGLCCLYGCCPSNPTQCKCPNSNQCTPNCSVQPTPTPAPIYTCDPGFISCPDNMTKGYCCAYGCCPSNPTQCKCPNSNQCSPNCSVTSEQPGSNPNPAISSSPALIITGIDSLTINSSVPFKRYDISLNITGVNFTSNTSCYAFSPVSGLGIKVKPSNFILGPNSNQIIVKAKIPLSKVIKKIRTLRIKTECSNGAEIEKVINLE